MISMAPAPLVGHVRTVNVHRLCRLRSQLAGMTGTAGPEPPGPGRMPRYHLVEQGLLPREILPVPLEAVRVSSVGIRNPPVVSQLVRATAPIVSPARMTTVPAVLRPGSVSAGSCISLAAA